MSNEIEAEWTSERLPTKHKGIGFPEFTEYARVGRFIESKCDRCGKATPARQNGIADLFVLDDEYDPRIACQGSFCKACIDEHSEADWLQWFEQHRPQDMEPTP